MSYIVEFAIEINDNKHLIRLERTLNLYGYAFYQEPPRDSPFVSLEDVECQCEGK